ncbi:hypothetical protein A2697_01430 [Candidatus Curtissbacteria bacterium RIFCSPHIGHO2_01_FULL_41_44]|uniref:Galactose isomerase n=1 Tax=Candidatus Curtissbacteria bacterium RIFCSPLOWO2_01_FULL_42_50 TaxID=1797730 RepID=A0A1F5H3I3_9BACT|nr:MAG: hypothetical protein A3C33_00640 [Candidatus Curtissbacteria bacterium RIFCSPHIGHO2_02_FULL_42_58]OGD94571.1 MAG: hypothetical protein A2697_01430 [Candidatus Curtissbacteria bacterium RIFCSPHIGHO2_01_FULL_41_44]OGD97953.1 MAG: hypothetical protein A3E71_03900 [Candidatus Curtissbacteria bacterium RIFCSPHIGHO2_12_FULL_42_33]OGD98604.1 MAG: hypothetical protein A3B54_05475 [Candidatus Curtissbacteria bacterium RIFCSPLOWO2_01_FULL_42_50]OGE02171.1 MAG: hypothetical protein A3G16_02285 [Ca
MKIVVASDEKTNLTDSVIKYLREKGHKIILLGDLVRKNGRWVQIGKEAAQKVASNQADQGILFCFSGTGICMAANRFKGARAALCWDAETAKLARKWDNANILCMSLRYTSEEIVKEILNAWFSTGFDEESLNEAHKLDE